MPVAAAARTVALTRSGVVKGIDFKLPAPLAVYTLSGVVRQGGRAVAKTMVRVSNNTWPRAGGEETDAQGRYAIQDVAGPLGHPTELLPAGGALPPPARCPLWRMPGKVPAPVTTRGRVPAGCRRLPAGWPCPGPGT